MKRFGSWRALVLLLVSLFPTAVGADPPEPGQIAPIQETLDRGKKRSFALPTPNENPSSSAIDVILIDEGFEGGVVPPRWLVH